MSGKVSGRRSNFTQCQIGSSDERGIAPGIFSVRSPSNRKSSNGSANKRWGLSSLSRSPANSFRAGLRVSRISSTDMPSVFAGSAPCSTASSSLTAARAGSVPRNAFNVSALFTSIYPTCDLHEFAQVHARARPVYANSHTRRVCLTISSRISAPTQKAATLADSGLLFSIISA